MGNGIALVAALRAQLDVTMLDVNQVLALITLVTLI